MRTLVLLSTLLLALVLASPPVAARAPLKFAIEFPDTPIPLPSLSDACGFEVFLTFEGTADVMLFVDAHGQPIREIDTAPGAKATLTSPFASLSFPLAVIHTTYQGDENGNVVVGSMAVVTITGFTLNPSDPAAGRIVFSAVVVGFVDGVPVTSFVGPPLFVAGNFTDIESLCASLG